MLKLEEIRALGKIDPEFAQLLEAGGRVPRPASLEERRKEITDRSRVASGTTPGDIEEFKQGIPMHDGHTSSSIVVKRKGSSTKGPLVVLYFGGGFISGDALQMVPYARGLARLYNATTVCVDYRLAPEHPFPVGPRDAYSALKWCALNAASLGANPELGLIVGGVSAGGNLAAIVAAKAQAEGLTPKVTGQWLSIPVLFSEKTVPEKYASFWISREQNAEAPGLNKESMTGMMALYKPDHDSSLWCPTKSNAEMSKLPSAYIQVDGMDVIRDDGLIYGQLLEDAGVDVRLDSYSGQVHAHWATYPTLAASSKAYIDIMNGIGWLLGQKVDSDETIAKAVEYAGAG